MSLASSDDRNAGIDALSKSKQPQAATGNNAESTIPMVNGIGPLENAPTTILHQTDTNALKISPSSGVDNKVSQYRQSIPSHYGQSQDHHPASNGRNMPMSKSIAENKQNQASDQNQNQNLAQTSQIVEHGFAQTQAQSSVPTAKHERQSMRNVPWYQPKSIPEEIQNHGLAMGQNQHIMQETRSTLAPVDAQAQDPNTWRAPVNGHNQNGVQDRNMYPNMALPSWTPLNSHSTATPSGSLSVVTPSSSPSISSVSNSNVSTDSSKDTDFSNSTAITEASGTAETGSSHINQTNGDLNTIIDANANVDVPDSSGSPASSHREKMRMPRGMNGVSGSGCLPQSPSQTQTHIQTQLQSGAQMSSLPQAQKKRKREWMLGPKGGESNSSSQSLLVSQRIAPSLIAVSPSLTSNAAINGVNTTEEAQLAPSMNADTYSDSSPTPLSDTVIGSDIVTPNQPLGPDGARSHDLGAISDSKANGNVASGPLEATAFATVHHESARPGSQPVPVTAQSPVNTPVPNQLPSTTPVPNHPRHNPHLFQGVGNVLQNLVATTGIDSRFVLRLSRDLNTSKKELRKWEANGIKHEIGPEQPAVGPHSNHVNQTHADPSIHSALVEKLAQKDNEIDRLGQELTKFREHYEKAVATNQQLQRDLSNSHSVLSVRANEIKLLVDRNRNLEVQLSTMQTEKANLTKRCYSLENILNKYANNNHPGTLTRLNTTFPTHPSQLRVNSPITPVNQQPGFPPYPIRRESISTVSTTPTQSPGQRMPPLPGTTSMAPVSRANAMPRAGSDQIQPYATGQQGYGPISSGPSSQPGLNHQLQRMESARHQYHPQMGHVPPSFTPPALSQFPSAEYQQSQQVSTAAQYQKQLLDKQSATQNQLIRRFEHTHRPQLPGSPSNVPPSNVPPSNVPPPMPTSRKQLVARHVEHVHSTAHGQINRRHSESAITHGTDMRGGSAISPVVMNPYPAPGVQRPRPPPIYPQLPQPPQFPQHPASQASTPVNTVSPHPLTPTLLGPNNVPLSYMAESFRQSPTQAVHQEIQKKPAPVPHGSNTGMQQPFPLHPHMQASPIQQAPQPTDVGSSLPRTSGESKSDVIDLTLDEDGVGTETDRPLKKRLRAEGDKEAGNQSALSTPADFHAPLNENVVDDVKVGAGNEAMAVDSEQVAERHANVPCASPSTLPNTDKELPTQSSIIDGVDISNPEVVDHLNEAFGFLSEEDHSLRYCSYCQFRYEKDPADCLEIARFRNPTVVETLNHIKEVHSVVFEAIRSGNCNVGQEQNQTE